MLDKKAAIGTDEEMKVKSKDKLQLMGEITAKCSGDFSLLPSASVLCGLICLAEHPIRRSSHTGGVRHRFYTFISAKVAACVGRYDDDDKLLILLSTRKPIS